MSALCRLLALGILFCGMGYPALTTISDTLKRMDGTTASGTITVVGQSMTTSAGVTIPQSRKQVPIPSTGIVLFEVEDNATATPAGTSYQATYVMRDGLEWVETWVVPLESSCAAVTTCTISEIRVTVIPDPSILILLAQISKAGALTGEQITYDGASVVWSGAGGSGSIDCSSPTELTISAGVITIAGSGCFDVDTEADASSDDLDSITCSVGVRFILRPADTTRTIVIKDTDLGAMDIETDCNLDNIRDQFMGYCVLANTVAEVSRSNAGS